MGWFNHQLGFFHWCDGVRWAKLVITVSESNVFFSFALPTQEPVESRGLLNCSRWWVVSNIFYFHPYLGKVPILTNIFELLFFFGKGGISGRFGKMFSRSAGTFNTRYLMTRRYPKKYELSCEFQDSSISHYCLSNLMYSHCFTSGFWLVSPCYYIFLTTKTIQPNPNPTPTSHPGFSPVFPPSGSLSRPWNQVNMEVKFSIPPYVSLLARSVATLEGVALQGDPQWRGGWMDGEGGR